MVATLLAVVAALAPPARETAARSGLTRIELFAPLGRVDEAPASVHWMSPAAACFALVRVLDETGAPLVARAERLAHGARTIRFTDAERQQLARAGSGWIEVWETSEQLELLARSAPGRFALRGPEG